MDFFEHQEQARRSTTRLVVLFILAVLAIYVMTYIVVAGFVVIAQSQGNDGRQAIQGFSLLDPGLLLAVGLGVAGVVGGGSLYKLASLRGGGASVAQLLNGRLLNAQSLEPDERKLLNIVEEMALASGTPVPPVYVMDDESGINAFAAGYAPGDAVIGVTRGAMRLLDRDELQGVIAHEFSHILNGDMRLNIRLIGLLHGILVIALIGLAIIRSMAYRPRVRSSRNSKDGGGQLAVLALGALLAVIGYIGVFFGRIIKAAVSRQREFLADAAAVQFTRHPEGIGGALKKIGGLAAGSKVHQSHAEEASHMFFGEAMSHWLGGMMATHPPLAERIRRIDPRFDGKFPQVAEDRDPEARVRHQVASAPGAMGLAAAPRVARQPPSQRQAPAITQVGQPNEAHLRYAATLIAALPAQVRDAARQPLGAQALVFALLLDRREEIAQKQINRLAADADPLVRQEFARLAPHVSEVDARARLPLIDIALGSLRDLSPAQTQRFRDTLDALIDADDKVELFEWTLRRMVKRHLVTGRAAGGSGSRSSLASAAEACSVVLSTLAYLGQSRSARAVFDAAAARLQLPGLRLLEPGQCNLSAVDRGLDTLASVPPLQKRRVLGAAAVCVSADHEVTIQEAELLRAIADSLECPMPPLLPGQPVT